MAGGHTNKMDPLLEAMRNMLAGNRGKRISDEDFTGAVESFEGGDIRSRIRDYQRAVGNRGTGQSSSLINFLDPESLAMLADYQEGTDKKGFQEQFIRTPEGRMYSGEKTYYGGLSAPFKNIYSKFMGPREVQSIPSQYILPERI